MALRLDDEEPIEDISQGMTQGTQDFVNFNRYENPTNPLYVDTGIGGFPPEFREDLQAIMDEDEFSQTELAYFYHEPNTKYNKEDMDRFSKRHLKYLEAFHDKSGQLMAGAMYADRW